MIRIYRTPRLFAKIFPNKTWSFFVHKPAIYLTFDDGPTEEITHWILKTLEKYNAKATFFCVGENAKNLPHLMEEIRKKGHQVGNHTMHHLNGIKTSTKTYINDVHEANKILNTPLFRPPYGRMKWAQYKQLKKDYRIIMWRFLTYDFDYSSNTATVLKKITSSFQSGDIIVLHDNVKSEEKLRELLPPLLEWGTNNGYTFAAIQK